MSVKDIQWRNWTMQDWNEALFEHFFFDSDGKNRPVHRIPVTGDELLKVVQDPDAVADKVQEAFLSVIRTTSHIEFNNRMRRYPTDPQVGWKGAGIPPFFAELAFSCLVASPPDGEIRSVGDFRYRLALLMDHDRSVANYPLETLSPLWEAFGRWIDARRATGSPYRRLELPPPDYRARIGYSINLAFPSRKDLENLIRVFSAAGLTTDPPIPTAFVIVGNAIHTFSQGFRRAYEEFREAYYRTRKTDLDKYPFWGAIREAVDSVEDTQPDEAEDGASVLLVMESGGMVLLLSDVPREVVEDELSFIEVDADFGEFRNVLCVGENLEGGIQNATIMLLRGRYRDHLTGKGWPSIRTAIEQGILLFTKTDRLTWELMFTLQEEGDCQALVKDSLAPDFLSTFHKDRRPYSKASRYQGWTELERFPGEWLASLRYDDRSPLAVIRCLQPTVYRPRLSLVGGCPIDGGYLGIPECLPSVRAPLSNKVELIPLEPNQGRESLCLSRHESSSIGFAFPDDFDTHLEGRFRFVGSRNDRVLVQKDVVFRPNIVVKDYTQPTNPEAWLVEAGGPDVISFGESCRKESVDSDRPGTREIIGLDGGTQPTGPGVQCSLRTGLRDWQRIHSTNPLAYSIFADSDDFGAARRLMEICGGLAMRRKGIPEWEFLELLKKTLTVDRYRLWDVANAWVEAGYLDRLMSRNWRRTEYFPRIPHFVLDRKDSQVRGALYGLATSALRSRVDVDLLNNGAKRIETFSFSEWLPPIPMWIAPDAKTFEDVSQSLALDEPTWVRPITDALLTLSKVASCKGDPPRFHDCWGCWDWERGWFAKETKPTGHGVEVVRFTHIQRPPFYQVLENEEHVWWSISRNWALLLAHTLLGVPCFALSGSDQVVRSTIGQVYLPLPIGRYLATTCPVSSGPLGDSPGAYCYQFRDSAERSGIMAAVFGEATIPVKELRRWGRWILDLSRRPPAHFDGRQIPLPTSVKKELDQFPDVPEFQELSRTRFAPSLLPRLRDGLSRFTKDRGE